jgi:hypothetical protein
MGGVCGYTENMQHDTSAFIGQEVKAITELIAAIDPYSPDEDMVEVLIGAVSAWGVIEAQVLFPALETQIEGAEAATTAARERLNTLYSLQNTIHDIEYSDSPFSELALKYIDGVKYHLVVDVQEMMPLAQQLSVDSSGELARAMAAMKLELE